MQVFLVLFVAIIVGLVASAAHASPAPGTILTGLWKNELGSVMNISRMFPNGDFAGTYVTAVGNAEGAYRLMGHAYLGSDGTLVLVWGVSWQNEQKATSSVTAWTGQVFSDARIYTTWILTSAQSSPNDAWKSTHVGTNLFSRM